MAAIRTNNDLLKSWVQYIMCLEGVRSPQRLTLSYDESGTLYSYQRRLFAVYVHGADITTDVNLKELYTPIQWFEGSHNLKYRDKTDGRPLSPYFYGVLNGSSVTTNRHSNEAHSQIRSVLQIMSVLGAADAFTVDESFGLDPDIEKKIPFFAIPSREVFGKNSRLILDASLAVTLISQDYSALLASIHQADVRLLFGLRILAEAASLYIKGSRCRKELHRQNAFRNAERKTRLASSALQFFCSDGGDEYKDFKSFIDSVEADLKTFNAIQILRG
jgi:hypothetical protein